MLISVLQIMFTCCSLVWVNN